RHSPGICTTIIYNIGGLGRQRSKLWHRPLSTSSPIQQEYEMSEITERGYHKPEVLVSTQWVEDHLNDPNIRIIESNEDALLYYAGHIPGAGEADWASDLNIPRRRDVL